MRKKQIRYRSPYAHLDWKKAQALFDTATRLPKNEKKYPTVALILRRLASVIDKGLLFIAKPDDPEVVNAILEGREPYSWRTRHVVKRLQQQKLVTIKEQSDGTVVVKITKNGRIRALSYQLDTMQLKKQEHWDGKWRVVIFDVPERYKRTRDIFRHRLRQLGLYQLQESVYVSPYACFDEIEFLRELYGIPFTVRYLLVERIEEDHVLHTHFNL